MCGRYACSYDLQRFVDAQDRDGTYEGAADELRRGRKRSHWMWFVFPQIAGLGHSPTSRRYAISSLDEARAYLQHPVLGPRLLECADIVRATRDVTAEQIFEAVDAQKLHSSMTLFVLAAPQESVFREVLERYFSSTLDGATKQKLSHDSG